jgi:hypothetical protein
MHHLLILIAAATVCLAATAGSASADPRRWDPVQLFVGVLLTSPPQVQVFPVPPIRYVSPFHGDDDDDDGWRYHDDDDDDDDHGWRQHDDDD